MAEIVGLTTGLVALTTFAFESSRTLWTMLDEYRNQSRNVRDLKQELDALDGVLQTLQETANQADDGLAPLKIPLLRCGQACQDFAAVVTQCTTRSRKDKSSFRDWMMLRYHDKDIGGVRNLIAAYKSTIAIALANINIQHVKVTQSLLEEYKSTIDRTMSDLEDVLRDRQPQTVALGPPKPPGDVGQLDVADEKASLEHCLAICSRLSGQLDKIQEENFDTGSQRQGNRITIAMDNPNQAKFITTMRLKDCKAGLALTSSELQVRLKEIDERLGKLSTDFHHHNPFENLHDARRKSEREEVESIRKCLAICADATDEASKDRVNTFEDVQMADDGRQVIVATLGDLISAKRITVGSRSLQVLGQMSDDSLQQSFKFAVKPAEQAASPSLTTPTVPSKKFVAKHGVGQKLDQ